MADDISGAPRDWLTGRPRREASWIRIIDAATQLIAERGATDLTAEDVCTRVGCSRATLYRHVGGKSAILAGIVTQRVIPVTAAVDRAATPLSGQRRVIETILCTVHGIRADPILCDALKHIDRDQMSQFLTVPESITPTDSYTPPYAPEDHIAARMMVRIIWSLVDYPLASPDEEREIATRFAHAFATDPSNPHPDAGEGDGDPLRHPPDSGNPPPANLGFSQ